MDIAKEMPSLCNSGEVSIQKQDRAHLLQTSILPVFIMIYDLSIARGQCCLVLFLSRRDEVFFSTNIHLFTTNNTFEICSLFDVVISSICD
jgi:hypothetical protein